MENYGISAMLNQDVRAPIEVFDIPGGHTPESIFRTLHHEIAHSNDWQSSQVLSSQERINLLYEITQRYNQPDRFKSEYVEIIQHDDKFFEAYKKTSEYWAEIVANYFMDPENFRNNNPKDAELVEKWFSKINNIEKEKGEK